jgi:hypothetical protein
VSSALGKAGELLWFSTHVAMKIHPSGHRTSAGDPGPRHEWAAPASVVSWASRDLLRNHPDGE